MKWQIVWLFWLGTFIQFGSSQTFPDHEVSHVALIGWIQPSGRSTLFDCTGSYIGQKMILTGARCLDRNGTQADVVRFGAAMDGTPQDFEVDRVIVHYRYQAEYYYHNMAIIYLKKDPAASSQRRFRPTCIYSRQPEMDAPVFVFGRDSRGVFQRTPLELVSTDKCHEFYNPTKKFKYGALLVCCMCAKNSNTNQCTTELAAPMQMILEKNGKKVPFMVGQKTIGKSCGSKTPGIYTRLSSDGHLPWIATVAEIDFHDHDGCINRY